MKNTIADENGSSVIQIANAVKKTGATAKDISCVLSELTRIECRPHLFRR
jgi:hypothetical protein